MLGGGVWGAALADHLARLGQEVRLWEFFPDVAGSLKDTRRHPHLPRLRLDPSIKVTSILEEALPGARIMLVVLLSGVVRSTAKRVRAVLDSWGPPRGLRVVNASKGIEGGTLRTMGEVLEAELPFARGRVFTLSGPSFAGEVADGIPTRLVLAGRDRGEAGRLAGIFEGRHVRVEVSADRKGIELGGSLKNVVAIGCGILDGLAVRGPRSVGADTKAALMTQGLAEMARLIRAAGGREESAYSVAGIGDLIATGTSLLSRNRTLGEKLGRGMSLKAALRAIPTATEGVDAAQSAHALAKSKGAACPLHEAIWRVLHRGAPAYSVVRALGFA